MKAIGKKNYPLEEVAPFSSIRELLAQAKDEAGDRIGYKYLEHGRIREKTYAEGYEDVEALGTALYLLGLSDKHVSVIGKNSYEWLTVMLATLGGPGVLVPVDKELPLKDIANVLREGDSEALFYAGKFEKHIDELREAAPQIKYFIGFEREEDDAENKKLSFKRLAERGREALRSGEKGYRSAVTKDTNELRMIVYTSGTTGLSKGVMLSEKNIMSCVYYGLQIEHLPGSCLSVLPYHHCFEAMGLVSAIHSRACICINENLKYVLKNLERFRPRYMFVVPAFAERFYKKIWEEVRRQGKEKAFKRLISLSDFLFSIGIDIRRRLFKSVYAPFGGRLEKLVCGGAPLRPEIGDFFNSIGISLVNGYGISECSPMVSANRDFFNDPRTVGVPMGCIELSFEDADGEGNGEICVKGDIVMLGYYKRPDLTAEVLSEDGRFRTGDYGRLNGRGQLVITGRKKNLIVLENGKNVFPEELENYILGIDYISEAVVRGLKNESGQEVGLLAEVYLHDEARARLSEELGLIDITAEQESEAAEEAKPQESEAAAAERPENRAALEERIKSDIYAVMTALPAHKQITKLLLRDTEFPKTTTNKIKR